MTLGNLLAKLDDLDDTLTIYAERDPEWTSNSDAVACLEPDDRALPEEARGMPYFLEVNIAKEIAVAWLAADRTRQPTASDLCERIIYYATNDA